MELGQILSREHSREGHPKPGNLVLIPEFLSQQECDNFRTYFRQQDTQVEQLPHRRRLIIDSPPLAEHLWQRLLQYPDVLKLFRKHKDGYGNSWSADGLNSRFRLVRYGVDDQFAPHYDGYWQPSITRRSFATVMIYLSHVEDQLGGSTDFLDLGVRVQPRCGLAVLFLVDDLLHQGRELAGEEKYILRTDLMYECPYIKRPDLQQELLRLRSSDSADSADWKRIFELEKQLRQ
jgi:hypothetical protein